MKSNQVRLSYIKLYSNRPKNKLHHLRLDWIRWDKLRLDECRFKKTKLNQISSTKLEHIRLKSHETRSN